MWLSAIALYQTRSSAWGKREKDRLLDNLRRNVPYRAFCRIKQQMYTEQIKRWPESKGAATIRAKATSAASRGCHSQHYKSCVDPKSHGTCQKEGMHPMYMSTVIIAKQCQRGAPAPSSSFRFFWNSGPVLIMVATIDSLS